MNKAIRALKRVSSELIILAGMVLLGFFFSAFVFNTIAGLEALGSLASVAVRVSCGILHAHISRKLLFPYIDFENDENWANNLLIILWYPVIIISWARGG
jgi:hypothetical protein